MAFYYWFQDYIGNAVYTGQILGTALEKSLRSKLTSTRPAENWLKYLSSFGYAITFDEGNILIFIFASCLHFRQFQGKDVQMTSFLSSPEVLETQYILGPRKALWCDWAFHRRCWVRPGETFALESLEEWLSSHKKPYVATKGKVWWSLRKPQNWFCFLSLWGRVGSSDKTGALKLTRYSRWILFCPEESSPFSCLPLYL